MYDTQYEIQLRYAGSLIGNIYPITTARSWSKVKNGVDQISFSVSMLKMQEWCEQRGTTLAEIVKPLKLDARVVRNGTPLLGGVLLEIPSYSLDNDKVDCEIQFNFDGYLNIYSGLYIRPTLVYNQQPLNQYLVDIVNRANTRAANAGASTGVTIGHVDTLPNDQNTYDSYKAVKDALTEQTDNETGAGNFDIDFTYDRKFCIYKEMGEDRTDLIIRYPSIRGAVNATSVSFNAWNELATHVIGVGAGNGVGDGGAAITDETTASEDAFGIAEYGYYEQVFQDSSISRQATLHNKISGILQQGTKVLLTPTIGVAGNQLDLGNTFWIGDRFRFQNDFDPFIPTSAILRALEFDCNIDDTGAENLTIKTEVYGEQLD